ncbi:21257_t:CDS:2 [Gigaspora margarita]|uniref:21257_t:CDS:1 n=1 Tax=Gigaspora margarita TaxID=4874 RepID=A0ABM8W0H5_GIGMA|nr:21257_t:CDS:2 [Gigaspora margarita]
MSNSTTNTTTNTTNGTNTTNTPNITNLVGSCGVNFTCDNSSSSCYLPQSGPICSNLTNSSGYKWRLNPTVFPPIEYLGSQIGRRGGACENFDYSSWSKSNQTWLLEYLRHYWVPNNDGTIPYNDNTLPPGSFVNPLDYIGSCSYLDTIFCLNQTCVVKYRTQNTCTSSNQCVFFACGNMTIGNNNITNALTNMTYNCVDDRGILGQLTFNQTRPWNVISPRQNLPNSPNSDNDRTSGGYSGQAVAVIVVIVIILLLISIGCCIKRFNSSVSTDLNPNTRNFGGRIRRNGSILGGGVLTRENSIRTLPPYTEMAEEPTETTETTDQQGVMTMITRYFFPPGELPPPYDSIRPNNETRPEDIRRDGVTFEELSLTEPLSRRSTITRHEGSSTNPLVLPEVRNTDSPSFENDQDQADETVKLNTQLEIDK